MHNTEWYYRRDGENHGPFSSRDLKGLADSGQLRDSDLVHKSGMDRWIPAYKVRSLFPPPNVVAATKESSLHAVQSNGTSPLMDEELALSVDSGSTVAIDRASGAAASNSDSANVLARPIKAAKAEENTGRGAAPPENLRIGTPNLAQLVHNTLRGRYLAVIFLGLIAGGISGTYAWKSALPIYKSQGLIRIAYNKPEVMHQTDQNSPVMLFDTFMQSQRLIITSRRTINRAIVDPIWNKNGVMPPVDPDKWFAANMVVDVMPRSEFIAVTITDTDPGMAAAAVTSVVNSYANLYNTEEKDLERQRIGVLEEQRATLQGRVDQLVGEIEAASQEYGSVKLDMFYENAAFRVNRLEAALAEVNSAIATYSAHHGGNAAAPATAAPSTATAPEKKPEMLSVEQIAAADPVMNGYLSEQTRLERQLDDLYLHELGEAHKTVIYTKRALAAARSRVREYAQNYRDFQAATGGEMAKSVAVGKSLDELRENKTNLETLHQRAREEMVALGNKSLALQKKRDDLQSFRDELTQLKNRIETLRTEESLGGRLSIVSNGEVPLSPDKDPRIKRAAAAGTGGALVPATLLILVSVIRRKYRYSRDTETDVTPRRVPLLGIIPELHSRGAHDRNVAAAHSVHQLRVSLQAQEPDERARAYLITSTTAGEGKTSLTMSLGLSFAASGMRTLIIDADLVGRRLTHSMQLQKEEGLQEAILDASMEGRVAATGVGVHVLGAGQGNRHGAASLSPAVIRKLMGEARTQFDVVMVDTGPMLGSLEASLFAREVDGVIFTISRGQQRHLSEQAMYRLKSLGARVVGCVFNRARFGDFHGSSYSYSGSYARSVEAQPSSSPAPLSPAAERFARFGPLVRAVAADVPSLQHREVVVG